MQRLVVCNRDGPKMNTFASRTLVKAATSAAAPLIMWDPWYATRYQYKLHISVVNCYYRIPDNRMGHQHKYRSPRGPGEYPIPGILVPVLNGTRGENPASLETARTMQRMICPKNQSPIHIRFVSCARHYIEHEP